MTGSGGTTYAYIYSTSNANTVAGPSTATFTLASGATTSLAGFQQLYIVGASDGTDHVTLDSPAGSFISSPQFNYVAGASGGSNFFIGAIYSANLTAKADSGSSDAAVFYSYPNDQFNGTPGGTSSLSGSTTNASGADYTFLSQAIGYGSVTVFESGSGTDVANLTSPGNGKFVETSNVSTLTVGTNVITVNTYVENSSQQMVAIPSQVVITGAGTSSSDTATLYDSTGSNALIVGGSKSTLSTSLSTVTVDEFGSVTAIQQNSSDDTVEEASTIEFVLSVIGNWT